MWYGSCLLSEWLWVTSKFGHLELKRSHPLKFKGVIWLMGYLYIYLGIWALTQCFFQVVFPEQWRNGSLSNNFKVSKCNELFSKAKLHLFSGKWSKGGEFFFFSDMWKEREVKESYHFSKIYVYTVSWSTWFSRKNKAICVALPLQITMVEDQLRLCTGFMLC